MAGGGGSAAAWQLAASGGAGSLPLTAAAAAASPGAQYYYSLPAETFFHGTAGGAPHHEFMYAAPGGNPYQTLELADGQLMSAHSAEVRSRLRSRLIICQLLLEESSVDCVVAF